MIVTNPEVLEILQNLAVYATINEATGYYIVDVLSSGTEVYVPYNQPGNWYPGVITGVSDDYAIIDTPDNSVFLILRNNVKSREKVDLAADTLRLFRLKNPESTLRTDLATIVAELIGDITLHELSNAVVEQYIMYGLFENPQQLYDELYQLPVGANWQFISVDETIQQKLF